MARQMVLGRKFVGIWKLHTSLTLPQLYGGYLSVYATERLDIGFSLTIRFPYNFYANAEAIQDNMIIQSISAPIRRRTF